MNQPNSDPLDNLLQTWAAATQATETHLDALQQRICDELAGPETRPLAHRRPSAGHPTDPASSNRPRLRQPWGGLAVAAAALTVCLLLLLVRPPGPPPHSPGSTDIEQVAAEPPAWVVPGADELTARSAVFRSLAECFPGQLGWVAETERDIRLGLQPQPASAEADASLCVVRLVVARRIDGQADWQPVWTLDVMTRTGEPVRLEHPRGEVVLWTHRLPDGLMAVETELTLDERLRFGSPATRVQQPGVPVALESHNSPDAEYRLFQTVAADTPG